MTPNESPHPRSKSDVIQGVPFYAGARSAGRASGVGVVDSFRGSFVGRVAQV